MPTKVYKHHFNLIVTKLNLKNEYIYPTGKQIKTWKIQRKKIQKKKIYMYTYIAKSIGTPLLVKGLTTLVISMSTNLNVSAYNDILGNLIV